jgi:hypothetical protein
VLCTTNAISPELPEHRQHARLAPAQGRFHKLAKQDQSQDGADDLDIGFPRPRPFTLIRVGEECKIKLRLCGVCSSVNSQNQERELSNPGSISGFLTRPTCTLPGAARFA